MILEWTADLGSSLGHLVNVSDGEEESRTEGKGNERQLARQTRPAAAQAWARGSLKENRDGWEVLCVVLLRAGLLECSQLP